MQLVIRKSSPELWVSLHAAGLRSSDDLAISSFSAQLEGGPKRIKHKRNCTVTVSFTPQREGFCEAVLELKFVDAKHNVDFVIERTLRGVAKQPTGDRRHHQESLPTNHRAHDNPGFSSGEGEELLDSDDTGISVSGENDGLDFGIVERMSLDGPFATPTFSLTIKNAEGFPAVTLVEERVTTLYGRDFSFIPGTECLVHIQFNPKFDGVFEATLELVFYDSERLARFVVSKGLHGIAGSLDDHKHFEFLNKEVPARRRRPEGGRQLPPSLQDIVDDVTFNRQHYDTKSERLTEVLSPLIRAALKELKPPDLNMDTYTQLEFLDQRPYEVEVRQRDQRYSVEMEDKDEDHLPEAIIGDFLWLDDIQDDIRYEARITKVDLFTRGRISVLRMSLRLPIDFNLYRGATFILRFRPNRITLRRQHHTLASSFTPQRRLLFPSASDIKPIERYLSRAEIDNLKLFNENVRDDDQQLQTVLSVLQQPKGSTPFIIFGP
ncbi:hypothetical protein BJV78DRAFT_1193695 [Lactifluus subvellereus]|nr:hypothetical protein BJV78DRAFT_1193695 [Lactifluus subvellereus]